MAVTKLKLKLWWLDIVEWWDSRKNIPTVNLYISNGGECETHNRIHINGRIKSNIIGEDKHVSANKSIDFINWLKSFGKKPRVIITGEIVLKNTGIIITGRALLYMSEDSLVRLYNGSYLYAVDVYGRMNISGDVDTKVDVRYLEMRDKDKYGIYLGDFEDDNNLIPTESIDGIIKVQKYPLTNVSIIYNKEK